MKIVYDPPFNKGNKYSEIISKQLLKESIETYSLKDFFMNYRLFKSIQIVHLNWFENLNGHTNLAILKDYYRKLILMLLLKIFKKKIIWTMHNKATHDKKFSGLKQKIFSWLVENAVVIVIHSKVSTDILKEEYGMSIIDKIRYIPHPHYIGAYGSAQITPPAKQLTTSLRLLFVGALKPYKNIELVVEAVKKIKAENIQLSIYGKPVSASFKEYLNKICNGHENIALHPQFVADDMLEHCFSENDVLVCPYDIKSSLNSGSVLMAFSYATTVICPNIGTIKDFEGNENIFSYDYESPEQHLEALCKALQRAVDHKKKDKGVFESYGKEVYGLVKDRHAPELVGKSLSAIYRNLSA